MKKPHSILILMATLLLNACNADKQDAKSHDSATIETTFFGQKPPDLIPEAFAPGVVSTEHRDNSAFFSPDMKTFYFTRMDIKTKKWSLMIFKYENDQWQESVFGPRVGRPFLSPDGQTMHLGGKYMERTRNGWSEVKSHGPMIDRDDWGIMRLSASAKGTYVFDDYKNKDIIRISRLKDGKREKPRLLGKVINTGKWTAHPFIAPDESYLIWDSEREEGHGDSDLYISFRQPDDTWGEAINLGDQINTSVWEGGASVTPDGKYLFFNRAVSPENTDIFWVDAKIIQELRPENN
ncbi:PD40 domain-containing protein [Roseivirga sp. E12]|uniref:PD40 domain-containing protein n=1 Tax=Roseivirga sp. E12 TaxID=2819237 RepID=UPI001ABC4DFC|nr:PD40 domain-containing protein [Roseivirga sp. E12]MBO3697258.1 PD40 domain-containing protein [Roseivirga sp. E12]